MSTPVQVYCVMSGVHYTRTVSVSQTVIQSVSQSGVSTLVQVYCVKSGVHYTQMVSVIQTVIQSVWCVNAGASLLCEVWCPLHMDGVSYSDSYSICQSVWCVNAACSGSV